MRLEFRLQSNNGGLLMMGVEGKKRSNISRCYLDTFCTCFQTNFVQFCHLMIFRNIYNVLFVQ